MQQHEFIFVARNLGLDPVQDAQGNTIIDLKPDQIRLFHSYKARNLMQIRFQEDAALYTIPGRQELELIYGIYLEHKNDAIQLIREYCDKSLVKKN